MSKAILAALFCVLVSGVSIAENVSGQNRPLVTSKSELISYLEHVPQNSPLLRLSNENIVRFTESLTFNKQGVTSFSYAPLRGLRVAEAHAVLALFGIEHTVARIPDLVIESRLDAEIANRYGVRGETDYIGYRCIDRATCRLASDHICMSSC